MNHFARLTVATSCVMLGVSWAPSAGVGGTRVTETTTIRNGVATTTRTVSFGSLYEPEPGLASLLKGQADRAKAAADWVSACAKVLQAGAQANLANAQAHQSLENARTEALANRVKYTTNFYEKQKLYEIQRELAAGPPRPSNRGAANPQAPSGPNGGLAEFRSGKIRWPAVLMHGDLLQGRIQLETLFAARSRDGTRISTEARAAIQQMQEQLRQLVRQMPPSDYASAKRFLNGLSREAQHTPTLPDMVGK